MIGKKNPQLSLLDGALSGRRKRSKSDTLLTRMNELIDWERIASRCETVYKDSGRGRPSIPAMVMVKCLVLQYMYDLSDPEMEDALIDQLSFQRFVGLGLTDEVPDFTTIWRFRERLVKAGLLKRLFNDILAELDKRRLILRRGTLVDATIVQSARKKLDDDGTDSPQQDSDARGTQKGGKPYFGYKGHIGVNEKSNIIRRIRFTPANVHDSRVLPDLISGDERAVFGDKAYAATAVKRDFRARGVYYGIMDKGRRGRPRLSYGQRRKNTVIATIRNAVERPFAYFKRHLGYRCVRYVTLKRNEFHFGFLCMIHNIRRLITLTAPSG